MPVTIARLLMCFGVLIGCVAVYIPLWMYIENNFRDIFAFIWAGVITSGLFALMWVLIWRGAIQWSPKRVGLTLLLAPLCTIPACLIYVTVQYTVRHGEEEIGWFVSCLVWTTVWITGTAIIWRENAKERGERLKRLGIHAVACPDCGYNLTGLKEAKCPECGAVYTLDQLYASITEQRAELGGD